MNATTPACSLWLSAGASALHLVVLGYGSGCEVQPTRPAGLPAVTAALIGAGARDAESALAFAQELEGKADPDVVADVVAVLQSAVQEDGRAVVEE